MSINRFSEQGCHSVAFAMPFGASESVNIAHEACLSSTPLTASRPAADASHAARRRYDEARP